VAWAVFALLIILLLAFNLELGPRRAGTDGARQPVAQETSVHAATSVSPPRPLPRTAAECEAALQKAGVAHRWLAGPEADGIAWPIVLQGTVGGVRIAGGGKPDAESDYLDCRLATTLLAWAPTLQARGVAAIDHVSMYRAQAHVEGTGKESGHAAGRAIDLGAIELRDGRKLSVLQDWRNRTPNADPCAAYADDAAGKLLRELVCDAGARGFFQVIVTPHHNAAHADHVHLEIDPAATSLWMH
jgi:hypothetical protein